MNSLPLHFRHLRRILLRRGRTMPEAEDLIQDAFVKMQEYCAEGGSVRHTESFLVRTVLRLASNARRDEHRDLYCDVEDLALIASSAPTPDEFLAANQCLERMRDALDKVSRRTREIFFMQRIEGRTYAEIAKRMGVSVSAVEKHIASALLKLASFNPQEENDRQGEQ